MSNKCIESLREEIKEIAMQKPFQIMPLLTVCIGFFMVSLDATVVNVALQSLHISLHTDLSGLQWTVDSYVLSFAALLLSAGLLGDLFGPKKVFCIGLTIFSISSALCGIALTLVNLIIARILQGIGAALLVATSLSLLQRIFIEPSDRARAFGVWGSVGGIAVAAGPVIGGFLISIFGWRSIFLLNIPFGLLGLFMASYYLPQMVGTPRRIKLLAQLASIVILGAAAYTFITAGASGWDAPSVKISMLLFVSFTILFVFTEILSDFPMLPKGIFRIKSFTAASIVGIIINFGFYGQLFVLSIYFQQIKNYSALETGFAFLPQAVVCAVTAFFCGKVTARKGPGLPMSIGLCAGVLGFIGLSLVNINTAYIEIIFPMLAVGFGMSFIAPAAVTAAMASAPTAQGGVVSGIISAVRQSGSLMGVAILGSLISHQYGMFASGMHMAFMVSAASYFIGLWFTIFWILPGIVMLT